MATAEKVESSTPQVGALPAKARVAIHASDRHMVLNHHEGDVLSFVINVQGLSIPFSCTTQELANMLKEADVKLPKPKD